MRSTSGVADSISATLVFNGAPRSKVAPLHFTPGLHNDMATLLCRREQTVSAFTPGFAFFCQPLAHISMESARQQCSIRHYFPATHLCDKPYVLSHTTTEHSCFVGRVSANVALASALPKRSWHMHTNHGGSEMMIYHSHGATAHKTISCIRPVIDTFSGMISSDLCAF
jgi:hypothetical protein